MTIILIDRQPILRSGMALFLKEAIPNVTTIESDTLASFLDVYDGSPPDLIIVGDNENNLGIEFYLISNYLKEYPDTRFIIYADQAQYHMALSGLESGVKGYFLKNGDLRLFLICIKSVLDGRRYICPEVTEVLLDHLLNAGRKQSKKLITAQPWAGTNIAGVNNRAF